MRDVDAFADAYAAMAARHARPAARGVIYLDNQATTPCDPRVVAAMLPFFTERFGNPHSAEHAMGQDAEDAVRGARAQLAALIGADPREVVFTSGATEANNIAIKGAARFAAAQGSARRRVVTVATEHKCVLESVADLRAEGFDPVLLPVGADGLLDPAALQAALAVPTLLVSVMAANNETGVLQDLPRSPRWRARPARCCTPTRRRRWARSRSTSPASTSPPSVPTRCMARRASARCTSAAARARGCCRCCPAAGRSAGCAPARCRPRWWSGSARRAASRGGDGGRGRPARRAARPAAGRPAARLPGLRVNGSWRAACRAT